jgi:hypothetical protein
VVVILCGLSDGRGVNDVVVSRPLQHAVETRQHILQNRSELLELSFLGLLEGALVGLRDDPYLEGESGSKRGQNDEALILRDQARALFLLLAKNIAKDAPLFEVVVFTRAVHLFAHPLGDNRQGDELGVRMLERGARRLTVVLEDEDVLEAPVLLEIQNAIAESPSSTARVGMVAKVRLCWGVSMMTSCAPMPFILS